MLIFNDAQRIAIGFKSAQRKRSVVVMSVSVRSDQSGDVTPAIGKLELVNFADLKIRCVAGVVESQRLNGCFVNGSRNL
jgi:hypothetical protein